MRANMKNTSQTWWPSTYCETYTNTDTRTLMSVESVSIWVGFSLVFWMQTSWRETGRPADSCHWLLNPQRFYCFFFASVREFCKILGGFFTLLNASQLTRSWPLDWLVSVTLESSNFLRFFFASVNILGGFFTRLLNANQLTRSWPPDWLVSMTLESSKGSMVFFASVREFCNILGGVFHSSFECKPADEKLAAWLTRVNDPWILKGSTVFCIGLGIPVFLEEQLHGLPKWLRHGRSFFRPGFAMRVVHTTCGPFSDQKNERNQKNQKMKKSKTSDKMWKKIKKPCFSNVAFFLTSRRALCKDNTSQVHFRSVNLCKEFSYRSKSEQVWCIDNKWIRNTERQAQQHVEWPQAFGNSRVHRPMTRGRCGLKHSWACLFLVSFPCC